MKKEDILAIDEFREMYGDEAADALVQYLTKKRKDLTAHEVLEDDGAFERFSNWAYTKLHVDVYEKFAKHDVGGFFKRSNVEGFRKMRPGVDPNYNYFLRGMDNESKDVHESSDNISELNDREIAKLIAAKFEKITGTPVSDIFNVASDDPIFDQEMVDKTFPSIKKWLEDHGIFKNRQDDILYELDDVLSSNHIGESINPDDKITLTLGQIKKMIKEYKQSQINENVTSEIKKSVEKYVIFNWKARSGDRDAMATREIYDLKKFLKDNDISVGDDDVKIGEKKVAEIEHNYSNRRVGLEYKELKPKVKWIEVNESLLKEYDDDYEICNKCGAEIDPCDALYVDPSEAYCSEECLNAMGYTLDDVIDDTEIDNSYESKIGEELEDKNISDISKVYDELKKTGKTDDEIGKVIGGIISTKQESTHSLSRLDNVIVETWDATDAHTYWNGNGKYQDIANRLSGIPADKLIEKFKIPYATASKFDRDRFQYYRFFNDGDTPTILKKDITDKYGKFPAHCDLNDDELFNFIAPRLEALIDTDLKLVKPYVDKVQDEDTSIEETAVFKKKLIIGDNNDGTITIMLTSQPSEDDKKMLRTLAGDENMDFKKDPEYSYWYASIKGKTPKEAEDQISKSFPDYAIEIDNDQDQIA